jgi:hypothetical protein
MSHFSTIKTGIRDRGILLRCLAEMGYSVAEQATIRGYQGSRKVDVAVRAKEGYDIGFNLGTDGNYQLVADWWGVRAASEQDFTRSLQQRVGEIQEQVQREMAEMARRVRHEYALQTTLSKLQEQGFQIVRRDAAPDGTVKIVARRWR